MKSVENVLLSKTSVTFLEKQKINRIRRRTSAKYKVRKFSVLSIVVLLYHQSAVSYLLIRNQKLDGHISVYVGHTFVIFCET